MTDSTFFKGANLFAAAVLATGATFAASNAAQAATYYATTATVTNGTFFGTGVLTGPANSSGAYLSNTPDPPSALGSITFGFGLALGNGAGADIELIDVGQRADETYDVALSLDGVSFSSIGEYSTLVDGIDIGGLFSGAFSFIRVTNTSTVNSPDLDAARAFHMAAVPLPASLPLLLAGLGGLGLLRRRKKS